MIEEADEEGGGSGGREGGGGESHVHVQEDGREKSEESGGRKK